MQGAPHSVQKSTDDSMHVPHILTLLNKYIISTRFAKKFLTWMGQLSIKMFGFLKKKNTQEYVSNTNVEIMAFHT